MLRSRFLLCQLLFALLRGNAQRALLKLASHDFRFVVLRAHDTGFYYENAQMGTVV